MIICVDLVDQGITKCAFLTMEMEEQPYERCMSCFLDQRRLHLKTIKRELFLKDLLTHRILHFQNQVSSVRATHSVSTKHFSIAKQHIMTQGKRVLRDIIIQRQKFLNNIYERVSVTTSSTIFGLSTILYQCMGELLFIYLQLTNIY